MARTAKTTRQYDAKLDSTNLSPKFGVLLAKAHTLNHLNHDLLALMQEMSLGGGDDVPPRILALALKQAGQISAQECAHIEQHGFNFYVECVK